MNPAVTKDDPRYPLALAMRKRGAGYKQIAKELHVREATLVKWLSGLNKGKQVQNVTPAPWAEGYRWFGCRWR